MVSLDTYYRSGLDAAAPSDWEGPELFDLERAAVDVRALRASHRWVLVEGIVLLAGPALAALLDLVVELDAGPDGAVARERRLLRDEGDASPYNTAHYFDTCVWPAHLRYRAEHAKTACPDTPRLVVDVAATTTQRDVLEQVKRFVLSAAPATMK